MGRRRIITAVIAGLGVLYAMTWACGVPAVRSTLPSLLDAADLPACSGETEATETTGPAQEQGCFRTNHVVAIFPLVVAARYDIQVRWGHGGWAMLLWLGGSPHVILRWITWIE